MARGRRAALAEAGSGLEARPFCKEIIKLCEASAHRNEHWKATGGLNCGLFEQEALRSAQYPNYAEGSYHSHPKRFIQLVDCHSLLERSQSPLSTAALSHRCLVVLNPASP
jgi:hypothetical protein